MVTIIASPTTTSQAATTIVKKANNCPSMVPFIREKVTNARFDALSINSIHIKTTIAFRRIRTPAAPIVKRSAER
jgi:hypothetical protein